MAPWQIARMILVIVVAAEIAACGPGETPSPQPVGTVKPSVTAVPSAIRSPSPAPTVRATASRSPSPVPSPSGTTYAVQKGDTLTSIAARFHVTLEALRAANPQVTDPTKLQIGQVLTIPSS